jgi:hypothetical protein
MNEASVLFGPFVGLIVVSGYLIMPAGFLDDLRKKFLWTKDLTYWMKVPITAPDTGFFAYRPCKASISASTKAGASAVRDVDGFLRRRVAENGRSRSTADESALWCEPQKRAWGEGLLPHAVGPSQLKPAQQRAVAALKADPASGLTRAQYEKLAGVSRSQAAYDLAELVEAGILERVGNGRATRYRLAREGGGQRHWTSDRIRAELEAFCATRTAWPSPADFKAAGRSDLYIAASRYGGIAYWTEKLGFARPTRSASDSPKQSLFRTKLAWAGAGALAALGAAAAAGAVFFAVDHYGGARPTTVAQPRGVALIPPVMDNLRHSVVTPKTPRQWSVRQLKRQLTGRAGPSSATKRRGNSTVSRSLPVHDSSLGQQTTTATGGRSFFAVTPASATGPTPLAAPSGGSAPPPLKSP